MDKIIKTAGLIVSCLTCTVANAADDWQYMMFFYNLRSINQAITDQQCADLYKVPREYNIVNDNVIYKKNDNYTLTNYGSSGIPVVCPDLVQANWA